VKADTIYHYVKKGQGGLSISLTFTAFFSFVQCKLFISLPFIHSRGFLAVFLFFLKKIIGMGIDSCPGTHGSTIFHPAICMGQRLQVGAVTYWVRPTPGSSKIQTCRGPSDAAASRKVQRRSAHRSAVSPGPPFSAITLLCLCHLSHLLHCSLVKEI
jgi:hypothetical protein